MLKVDAIKTCLAHLSIALPITKSMSEGESLAFWEMYIGDIKHLSLEVVEETCCKIRTERGRVWFPTQGEFLKASDDVLRSAANTALRHPVVEVKSLPPPTKKDLEYRKSRLKNANIKNRGLLTALKRLA